MSGLRWAALLAVLIGVLLPLSLAPFGWWPLAIVSAGGLFYLVENQPRKLPLLGWLFGVGKYGLGASWVYVSIHEYGHASAVLSAALVALFVGFMALFPLTQLWLYAKLRAVGAGNNMGANAILFIACWVLWEWLLTWVLSGFPWLFAGSGQLLSPFAGYAPVGGVLLVSVAVVSVGCAAASAVLLSRRRSSVQWLPLLPALLTLGVGWWLGQLNWVVAGESRSVALVQGNVDQASKWRASNRQPIVAGMEALSDPHWGVDLLLWPEAAITLYEHEAAPLLARWRERGRTSGTTLVLGLPSVEVIPGTERAYQFSNLAVAVGAGSGRYAKRRLVPFGEYVPFEGLLRGLIGFFDLPMSHAVPGAARQALLKIGQERAAMAICYEVAYPGLVGEDFPAADVLLTISNDAWFGGSLGPHQHLQIAQMRALENGRYLLRATNTGLTAIADERGRIVSRLPQFEAGVLRGEYRLFTGVTPFAQTGSAPTLAVIVLALVVVVFWRAFGQPKRPTS